MSAFARSKLTIFTGAVLLGFAACAGAQSLAAPPGGPLPQTQASNSNERDGAAPIPPLTGRLFFSREQRERMDRARARGAAGEMALSGESFADPPPPTLNGFVKRSDGQVTIWVDNQVRFSALSRDVDRLTPQDVGGSSNRVNVLAAEHATQATPKSGRVSRSTKSTRGPRMNLKPPRRVAPSQAK